MKKCIECGQEFTPATTRGTEQIYCTKTCGRKAAQKRHHQRIIEKIKENEKKTETQSNQNNMAQSVGATETTPKFSASDSSIQGSRNGNRTERGIDSDYYRKDYLEKYFEARIHNNALVLKNEYLEKRVLELERQIFDLNSELEELDQEEQDSGIVGNIMEQFKKDPINSVKFASSIIENLTKSKS